MSGMIRLGKVRYPSESCLWGIINRVRYGLVGSGLVRSGKVRLIQVWLGWIRSGILQSHVCGVSFPQSSSVGYNEARSGRVWYCVVRSGAVW